MKTIIFGTPDYLSLNQEIIKNLEHCGYRVIDVSFDPSKYRYKKFSHRFINFLKKNLQNDFSFKKELSLEEHLPDFKKRILDIEKADYALFIRPDMYSVGFLEFVKGHTDKMIGYQWDGMDVFPEIKKYTHLFHRFFVFDKKDVNECFLPLTNFYFDYRLPKTNITSKNKNVYFVGAFYKRRIEVIKHMAKQIIKYGYDPDIFIFTRKDKVKNKLKDAEGIKLIENYIDFDENLKNVEKSDVLIDFLNNIHKGLSLRTFEALAYNKKLITNNDEVKKYDFYNENNIFIFNDNNLEQIGDFLSKPYQEPLPEIKEKYGFSNWIRYVLDEQPYQKIELP